MTEEVLRSQGYRVSRKRVRRLMRIMGLQAIYPKKNLSLRNHQHKIYPYLLRDVSITKINQVWSADITYIPLEKGFCYLVVIIDWYSRKVLSWRISNTLDASFCIEALEEAQKRFGTPKYFNTDQGSQFTCMDFITSLKKMHCKISMDGKGRAIDNIFVERLWRSVKYEEVYPKCYATILEAKYGLNKYFEFYNTERPHQSLAYKTPDDVYTKLFKEVKPSVPIRGSADKESSLLTI